jgi:NAD(P)H-dependent flavin oxidoreductase YrpB (nitropropane dioxygenase family)
LSSVLDTKLCKILGIRYPIIQTAMGWIATPELVAASCNAGALGFLAAATIKPEDLDAQIARTKQLTDKPFGVNFLMEVPGADSVVDTIIRHQVKAASYGRAPNPEFIKRFKDAGILCIPTCGAARHAQKAVQLGADIVVVQGGEGGGHTGTVPTSILVSQVVDLTDAPVVAAGGFKDGRGLVAAPPETAKRYMAASVNDILVTKEVDGMPQRVIRNKLVQRLESSNKLGLLIRALRSGLAYRKLSGASIRELLASAMSMQRAEKMTRAQTLMAANAPVLVAKAMVEGHPDDGVLPSGTVVGAIEDIPTCEELIQRIMEEAEQTLKALAS